MSRIPLAALDQQPDAIGDFTARRGELNLFRLLANAPQVFVGWIQMVDEMLESATFSPRLRELIILRVAHLQDCAYEYRQHLELARRSGLTDPQISALVGARDLDTVGFDRAERTVLDLVTELCTTRRVGDATFAAAHAALGDAALTELLMLISSYYGLAFVLNAADLDIDTIARLQP